MAVGTVGASDFTVDANLYVGTFLFTDIEDSTPWNRRLGDVRWLELLAAHHGIIRQACERHHGVPEGEPQGDGFLYFFDDCASAARAAADAQRALQAHPWPHEDAPSVRMGLHTGVVGWSEETGRTGLEINRASRIMSAAHGAQVLLSEAATIHLGKRLPPGTTVAPIGSFRLKGFGDEALRLYELVIDGAVCAHPVRAQPVTAPKPPRYSSPLVGRDADLAEVGELLAIGRPRVITLLGQGGVGKTRLAAELLAIEGNSKGVFVDISQLDEPSLLTQHLASALGLSTSPLSDPIDLVAAELADRTDTIVLDNFEQVVTAAPIVQELVDRSACQFVVTSRRRLGIADEHVHFVRPLSLAGSSPGGASPAAQLFLSVIDGEVDEELIEHATGGLIDRVCERLDGLPLAIELAAARAPLVGLEGLEAALSAPLQLLSTTRTGLPERHRSIVDTVAWSYDLLPGVAKAAFLQLSLLPGGCVATEVARVSGLDEADGLDAVEALVDAQLLFRIAGSSPVRYGLPRLMRDFGVGELERQGSIGEAKLRAADLLVDVAAAARSTSHSSDQLIAVERVDDELDNIRALLGWGLLAPEIGDLALRVATELVSYWWARRPEEGLQWLQRLLDANPTTDSPFKARALIRTAFLASWRGEADMVIDFATRGIDACRATGRRRGTLSMGLHLRALAWAAIDDPHHWALAMESLQECEMIDAGLVGTEQAVHNTNVADVYLADGRLDEAEALYRASLATFHAQGEAWFRAAPTSRLGEIALRRGDIATAQRLMAESVVLWRSAGSRAGTARAVAGLARVARADGRLADSHRLTTEAWSVMRETKSTGEAPWVIAGIAGMVFDRGDAAGAAQLLGGAARLARAFGQPVVGCITSELADLCTGCVDALGADEFHRCWSLLADSPPAEVLAVVEGTLS